MIRGELPDRLHGQPNSSAWIAGFCRGRWIVRAAVKPDHRFRPRGNRDGTTGPTSSASHRLAAEGTPQARSPTEPEGPAGSAAVAAAHDAHDNPCHVNPCDPGHNTAQHQYG